ncbi:DUF624 domain-containing protein [Amycolatopsis rifamycinica]|uniref:DUF624 domain-containing protein n=1 Tax=Amycolatopsis rifamycinica TaxID=287986 RepID=A0A066U937_9PSEU|nr:DUF624 domain-containing protein [Amycolatopsis rifamycinica]KDN22377.1 hypothetical protein DV20_10730 [Amycolatopsis rifamycinica]
MRTPKRSTEWRTGLGDFSDCLLAGLLVALASVPVVTAAPAFVAGCRVLDRTRRDVGGPLWTTFWADFRSVARGGLGFGLGCLAAVLLFAVDLEVVASTPGAGVLRPALWLLAAAGAVVAVRTCELVATGAAPTSGGAGAARAAAPVWRRAFVTAARETAAGPKNAVLLAAALGIAVLLAWMLPILALVVAGPLALAAVATGGRR